MVGTAVIEATGTEDGKKTGTALMGKGDRMTKAEAIAMLKRLQEPEAWEQQITQAAFEALGVAIKALEQQPCDGGKRKMTDYKYLDNYMQLWKKYVQRADNVRTILNEAYDYLSENQIEYFTELLARFEEKQELYYNRVIGELTFIDDTEINKDVKS